MKRNGGRREDTMVFTVAEKNVVLTKNGTALSVMESPGSVGSIENFHKKLVEIRKQYGHLLKRQSLDEYLAERRLEAERE
jgi:hypothetical protein